MVDNQHKKITGYRDLTEDEISDMNRMKQFEAQIASTLEQFKLQYPSNQSKRDLALAQTYLENGFMRAIRAVANPETPWK